MALIERSITSPEMAWAFLDGKAWMEELICDSPALREAATGDWPALCPSLHASFLEIYCKRLIDSETNQQRLAALAVIVDQCECYELNGPGDPQQHTQRCEAAYQAVFGADRVNSVGCAV